MFYIFWDPRENPPLTNLSKIDVLTKQMFDVNSPLMSLNLLKLRHLLQLHSNTGCDHTSNNKKLLVLGENAHGKHLEAILLLYFLVLITLFLSQFL